MKFRTFVLEFMPKISNKIKLGILFFIFAGVFLIFQNSFSYDDKTTHPGLTDEIVDFYNLSFGDKLTDEEKEWIVQGAIDEDAPPRWINHFYDPVYKTGWSGEKTGIWPTLLIQYFSNAALSSENPASSLDWLHNQGLQSQYGVYKGNRTWERAIYEAAKAGNKKEAYYTLGFILHLIEDASVPDHTRNDTHAHELSWATLDYGSPYEEFAKQFTRQNLQIAQELKNENSRPIVRNSIDEYLISLAEYSNKYFFSKDTINDPKYQYPKIIKEDEKFGYGKDENNKEFPLANIKIQKLSNYEIVKFYDLQNKPNYYPVLDAYFSRLSRQGVINGVGIINLFKQEVAKAEKEKLQNLPKESSAIWSLTGRFYQIKNFISAGVNLLSSPIKNFKENLSANVLSTLVNSDAKIQNNNQELAAMSVSAFQSAGQQSSNSTSAAESPVVLPSEEPQEQPALIPSPSPQIKPAGEVAVPAAEIIQATESEAAESKQQAETKAEQIIQDVPLVQSAQEPAAVASSEPQAPPSRTPSTSSENSDPVPSAPASSKVSSFIVSPAGSASPPIDETGRVAWPPPPPTITLHNGLDFATSTASQVLTGMKSEGVAIEVNNSSASVEYPSSLTWSKEVTLQEGLNAFSVKAKSSNAESAEVAIQITLDSIPPAVPQITSHSDNQILNTSTILLTGTAEASSTILITQNNAELGETAADGNGAWQKSITLASGANNFLVIAKDAVGNQSPALNFILYFSNYQARAVVINEIAWAGTRASDDDEWIELYNPGTTTVDLTGWQLISSDNTPAVTLSGSISAYGFYLLERSTDDATVSDIAANQTYTGALNNGGEYLKLLDPNAVPIDEVNASASWFFAGENKKVGNVWQRISMERINPSQSGSEPTNWGTNNQTKINGKDAEQNDILGTPQKANSLYVPILPSAISNLAISSSENDSVTLSWSAPSDADALNSQLGYDIRYSKKDLSEDSEWDKADEAAGEPSALEAGQTQTFTISGLEADKTYYFAVKTFDPENNYSLISNIVNFQTPEEEEEEPEVVYEQNFDALNDAPLCNQDGWGGWCHWTVLVPYENEGTAYNGDKAVRNNSGGTHVSKTFASTQKALISIAVKLHHSPTLQLNLNSGDTLLGYVRFNVYDGVKVVGKNSEKTDDFSEDVWHLAQIETDSDKKRFRAKLGDGSWSDWEKFFDNAEGDLNKIEIYYWKPNLFTDYAYFDAISISEANN